MQIKRHIEVLDDFEQKYGEYLVARHNRELEGRSDWSSREWAERERQLRMLAPRAEAAIEASGVEGYAELSSLILGFKDWVGFSVDARDDDVQREILRLIPSQLAGLYMRLEEAEAASREKGGRLRNALTRPIPNWNWLHRPNPWVLLIVGTTIATVFGLAIWAAIST